MAEPIEYFTDGHTRPTQRDWVGEAPVALEFNGIAYAVMMATPTDLADFATGFALTEGLAPSASVITAIAIAEVPLGWIARVTIPTLSPETLATRIRTRIAESSCGLCGIESLEALARPLPPVPPHPAITPAAIFAALAQLPARQTLGQATGAAHAAAWADATGQIGLLREDVGRHTALDKLAGAMARAGRPLAPGFILSTARCSFEIVEKAVRAGATTLVTISLPTSLAVDRARTAGLSLWALARRDSVLSITP
jgi:FdhD protein